MSVCDFTKKLLNPGRGGTVLRFKKNSKAVFHFRTIQPPDGSTLDSHGDLPDGSTIIDDSRTMVTGPFELLIGREFKMSVWEELIKTMTIGEVARFTCPFERVIEYPQVSKALRDLAKQLSGQVTSHQHHCSLSAVQGTGHSDLDKLTGSHSRLIFELELLKVDQPGEYKKEHWAMTEDEKKEAIPKLKEDGNSLYKERKYSEAAEKYFEALSYLEQMTIKEKPQSDFWNTLMQQKIPFLLNYAQCKLLIEEYAEVIRHTTTVLEFDDCNVKALFRRARAHSACWNVKEAKEDFQKVCELDPSLAKTVTNELKSLASRVKEKDEQDRKHYKGKMF